MAEQLSFGDAAPARPRKPMWSGIVGAGAARTILDRVQDPFRRDLLYRLAADAGLSGAPAMEHLARTMRWMVDDADKPVPPSERLRPHEIEHVERRARELLQPYHDQNDDRLARHVRDLGRPDPNRSAA